LKGGLPCIPPVYYGKATEDVFTLVVVASGLFGLTIGSFLNVVIYRVPVGKSIVRPPSACGSCGTELAVRDNIPLLSWLFLRGRCRYCQAIISPRYPIVEALTAVLFTLTAVRFGASWTLPAELAFVAALIALAAVDLERYLLPRAILYPSGALVVIGLLVAAAATDRWGRLGVAALCGLGAFALFFAIHFAKPAWLGFGDVRLAALLGLGLGWIGPWYLFIGFMAANLAGALLGVGLMVVGRASRTTALPYGVFLGAGSVFSVLVGAPIIAWYSHHLVK
jgi:leader peptidase (prepilin peptidase)/N-methyltransferase